MQKNLLQNKKFVIYMHRNKFNKKVYIGQTCDIKKRWYPSNYNHNPYFSAAIVKYGWDNFEHLILLENLSLEEANQKEVELIQYYEAQNPLKGYNIAAGGKNSPISEETRKKMSQNHRDVSGNKNYFYGKHFCGEQHPFYGKKHSNESKEKMSKNRMGKGGKKVKCLETQQEFETLIAAAKWCGLQSGTHIGDCCRGERQSAGKHPITKEKLHWKYIE